MVQRVRKPHRGHKPFVCHSTPHFDSTSREVFYSVRMYHTRFGGKCKYFFIKKKGLTFAPPCAKIHG